MRSFAQVGARQYLACGQCGLVHLAPEQRLSSAEERERYAKHQNHPSDSGYRAFLSRLAIPLAQRLTDGAEGLDYGSGPGPTLSVMLQEQGFRMAIYDPHFARNPDRLQRSYDFITCTEAAEHFDAPAEDFDRLQGLLRPGGWLGVMTELLRDDGAFHDWYYMRDPTHVSFYRPETMGWIARAHGWTVEFPHRNVALFGPRSECRVSALRPVGASRSRPSTRFPVDSCAKRHREVRDLEGIVRRTVNRRDEP